MLNVTALPFTLSDSLCSGSYIGTRMALIFLSIQNLFFTLMPINLQLVGVWLEMKNQKGLNALSTYYTMLGTYVPL